MKDIVITAKRIKKELLILAACFAIAFLINVIAIIMFKTPWYEMFTQLGYVVVITTLFYLLLAVVRGVASLIRTFSTR